MIILKQVIHDVPTNSVEATWVERTTTPAVIVPESVAPDTVDADGNVILGAVTPQHIIPAFDTDVRVRCHSYADRQMQMFRDHAAIAGTPLTDYEDLIALVESNIQPIPPPTAEELAAIAQAEADAQAKAEAKADNVIQYLRDHTPAECEAYVQAQVTDLASAKQLMKKFAVALCVLAKQSLR